MDDTSSSYLGQRRRHGSGMQALWRALPSPSIGWGPRQPHMRTNPLYLAFFSAGSEPHWWPFFFPVKATGDTQKIVLLLLFK